MNRFDPERHVFTIDDRPVPSITQALVEAGIIQTAYYNEAGRQRGTFVHQALDYLDRRDLDTASVPAEYQGYLGGYQEFKACTGFEPDINGIEVPLFHPVHLFGGIPDRWGRLNGSAVVLEIKTGEVEPWAALQTAAQALLINFVHPDLELRRHAIRLTKEGKWKLKSFSDRRDEAVFLAALQVCHWRRAHA